MTDRDALPLTVPLAAKLAGRSVREIRRALYVYETLPARGSERQPVLLCDLERYRGLRVSGEDFMAACVALTKRRGYHRRYNASDKQTGKVNGNFQTHD